MCGRYTLTTDSRQIALQLNLRLEGGTELLHWAPRYNIAPTQKVPVIISPRRLVLMRWGLVPSWAKDPSIGNRMINARSDTAPEKPSFRAALEKRRCLIPTDGFYEWQPVARSKKKQPYRIRVRSRPLFCLAGLWEHWNGNGEILETFTILTTEANSFMQPIHARMPLIVPPELESLWLSEDPSLGRGKQRLERLLAEPYPSEDLIADPVSTQVNSPQNDSPELITPIEAATSIQS